MAPFARDAMLSVSDFYPYGYFEQTDTCTAYLSHAISVLDLQLVESDEDRLLRASMLHRVGGFFLVQGRYADAEKLQREGTEIRIELLGEEDTETFVSMLDLSNCLQYQAQYDEAEKLGIAILETCKQLRGEEHPQTLDAMSALASKYYDLDKEEEAKRLWTYVSETRKRVLGENHEDTLAAMSDLALSLEGEEQVEMQKHIIEVETRTRGADHPGTLTTRSNLAMARYRRGEVAAAEGLLTELLEVRKRVLGDEHPDTVVSMMHLGQVWTTLGTQTADTRHLYPDVDLFGDAKRLLEECVRLQTKLLGSNHPVTLQAFTQLNECQEAMELADRDEVNRKAVESNGQVEL
jgi:tetratricopeptide (TPR) repeat protein